MAVTKTTVASASARNAAASKPAWPRSKESSRSSKANPRILGSERGSPGEAKVQQAPERRLPRPLRRLALANHPLLPPALRPLRKRRKRVLPHQEPLSRRTNPPRPLPGRQERRRRKSLPRRPPARSAHYRMLQKSPPQRAA